MPLPVPNLDDLTFQEIVDHARKLIPIYCPEWTDHNVSDPGITMIELFASMSELLLYRVNQVPEKLFITFLNLLGITLDLPRVAHAPVTFYLAAAATEPIPIDSGTRVSTLRTETREPIVFTTTQDRTIIPPKLKEVRSLRAYQPEGDQWARHTLVGNRFSSEAQLFSSEPNPGDTFYLGMEEDTSAYVIDVEIMVRREQQGQAIGIVRGEAPPQIWEASAPGAAWTPCVVEHDTTTGFNFPGRIRLRLPMMEQATVDGVPAFWLRCRLTDQQRVNQKGSYTKSPHLDGIAAHAMGCTLRAEHAITVEDELLGISDGTPGQTFRLRHGPLLSSHPDDHLVVQPKDGPAQIWKEVPDFADSSPDDLHYLLDHSNGLLALGPVLPLPSGGVYRYGALPPAGSRLTMQRYQYGGGLAGNVAIGTLTVLPQNHPHVRFVTNWEPGRDGRDGQSLEEAMLRAPRSLRTRDRAVVAEDFEYLACAASPQVGRAHCLAPGEQADTTGGAAPGSVVVVVLPHVTEPNGYLSDDQLTPAPALLDLVRRDLGKRMLLGVRLEVQAPSYLPIAVHTKLRVEPTGGAALREVVQHRAEQALYRYLNPYVGGPENSGWPFGRTLYAAEIGGLLQQLRGVAQVVDVKLIVGVQEAASEVALAAHQTICSHHHVVICS